ncbi:uncharacterized protein DSM5745_00950 [Aspergillus mulundensis]|uniref:Uncharacterized protein n=1 Tax=Aspergillus mulundensis TaxID=1810919 RepID=A0A3D8T6I0_9EURO|nr:hypothetical protein DSM5745_00950 [Aspergillus mulundensis]RDW93628.1 hypothetical protein DSM5745_00950 [Aspergillus mulundensis]
MTRGAGAFSISPTIRVHAVVSWDSPAVTLFQERTLINSNGECTKCVLQHIKDNLFQMFRDGTASPTDRLPDNSTLLHAWFWCPWRDLITDSDPQSSGRMQAFIRDLIEAGVPVDEQDLEGRTVLDVAIQQPSWIYRIPILDWSAVAGFEVLRDLLTYGSPMKSPCPGLPTDRVPDLSFDHERATSEYQAAQMTRELLQCNEFEDFVLSELDTAILTKSEASLARLLALEAVKHCEPSARFSGYLGVLWLCLGWPEGIRITLQSGLPQDDRSICYCFRHACREGEHECARILLEYMKDIQPYAVSAAISTNNPEIFSEVIRRWAVRQSRLREMALQCLPNEAISTLPETTDGLLDTKTSSIHRALFSRGIQTDFGYDFCFHVDTVYNYVVGDMFAAQMAYDAGFTDLNQPDPNGITPLMALCCGPGWPLDDSDLPLVFFTRIVHWMVGKGANLYQVSAAGYPALWYLAEEFGLGIHNAGILGLRSPLLLDLDPEKRVLKQIADPQTAKLLSTFLTDRFRDECICACGEHGCSALLLLLHRSGSAYGCKDIALYSDRAADLSPEFFTPEDRVIMSQVIIRYLTFKALELTHTCHHGNMQPHSAVYCNFKHDLADDWSEIRDEQRLLIEQLDSLVAEFTAEYSQLIVRLYDYVQYYWQPRMDEVLAAPKEGFDEDEVRRVQEVGVIGC